MSIVTLSTVADKCTCKMPIGTPTFYRLLKEFVTGKNGLIIEKVVTYCFADDSDIYSGIPKYFV